MGVYARVARLSQLPLQHALHDWCLRRVRSIQQSVDPLKGQSVFIILALSLYYTMKGLGKGCFLIVIMPRDYDRPHGR